jgi:hypothetical protein
VRSIAGALARHRRAVECDPAGIVEIEPSMPDHRIDKQEFRGFMPLRALPSLIVPFNPMSG